MRVIARAAGIWLAALLLGAAVPAGAQPGGETRYVALADISLRVRTDGAGPPIVLLHEMGMSLESWDDIVPTLAATHRVIRYDLRGFGLSEKIAGAVTIEQEVADLSGILDALGIREPVVLVGGAVGGAIALRFAADRPERVAALVAISPAVDVPPAARAGVLERAARIERGGIRALLGDMEDIYPSSIRRDPARVARFRAIQLATDPVSMAATLRMIATTDHVAEFPRIKAPALIVAAELYPARPVTGVRAIARAIPNGRFLPLPTGHFMAIQSPELLLPSLQEFLASVDRTAHTRK
jgi:3-oxoadipate enol-lactonase